MAARIERTLTDRPWARCGCALWGIEIAIFRGNNRNRRRGFHNTYVFCQLLGRLMNDERIPWLEVTPAADAVGRQLALFSGL